MSEEFHVHGAHDHAVEHQAHGGDSLASSVAIFTAILASVGAVVSYQGGDTQNQAMLKKTQASDQWSFYQAKSNKGHLMELAADMGPASKREYYKTQIQKYENDKKEIKLKAEALEAESEQANQQSEHTMHPHHKLAQAMTLIQIAISLASITVLTRRKWLFVVAGIAAAGGLVMWGMALTA
jgi:Mg-chelatase subunit ChlI